MVSQTMRRRSGQKTRAHEPSAINAEDSPTPNDPTWAWSSSLPWPATCGVKRFAKAAGKLRIGPEIDDFRPVFYCKLGWRWLPTDDRWTPFGHTGGHTGADANRRSPSTRRAPRNQ